MPNPAPSLPPDTPSAKELASLLDRARQERFRLLELLQDARAAVQTSADQVASTAGTTETPAAPAYTGAVQTLIDKVQRLNTVVDSRLEKLEAAESRVKGRIDHLERLELKMTNLAERFGQLINDAREIEPVLSQAEERAVQLRAAADALQQHGHDLTKTIDTRLAEQTAEFERRLDEHHEALVSQQIKEFGSFSDALLRQKQTHLDQLHRDLAEKRVELIERYARQGEDAIIDAEQDAIVKAEGLRERLAAIADEVLDDADRKGKAALDTLRERVVTTMGRADDINRTVRQRLEDALLAHGTKMEQAVSAADEDLLVRGQQLDERLAGLHDLFDHQADQIMDDLKQRANTMLDQMAASLQTTPNAPASSNAQGNTDASSNDGPQLKVA